MKTDNAIRARGVRVHNLKNIDVDVPRGKYVAVTGVSGSGKSSLALDTLYAEGQRRYIESFSAYARQFLERMDKPDVDAVENVPPAIAIEQKNPVKNRRSTVGTATELNDYMRLFWARVGHVFCPDCDREIVAHAVGRVVEEAAAMPEGTRFMVTFPLTLTERLSTQQQADRIREMGFVRLLVGGEVADITADETPQLPAGAEVEVVVDRLIVREGVSERLTEAVETCYRLGKGRCRVRAVGGAEGGRMREFTRMLRCTECGREMPTPTPQLFSFNNPLGACENCSGYGATIAISRQRCAPDPGKSLRDGAIAPWTTETTAECLEQLLAGAPEAGIPVDVPWGELEPWQRDAVFEGTEHFYGVMDFFDWLETKKYKLHVRVLLSRYRSYVTCQQCGGTRLTPEARAVKVGRVSIADVNAMTIERADRFFREEVELTDYERKISSLLLREIRSRLDCLVRIGLGYLTLDRHTRTLSGGEMQRVNLTTSLGSALVNTLYILDEPSIGLHARDADRLIAILKNLRDCGNTVVVVEHDRPIIEAADHVIDLGPGAGERGGRVVYSGPADELCRSEESVTGAYLRGELRIPVPRSRRKPGRDRIALKGARQHNLKGVDVEFPLGLFTCVTGVSGSGKSTLVRDTLYGALKRHKPGGYAEEIGEHDQLTGHDLIDDVILVDQSPIGRTPRSNPATYIKAYGDIRRLFAGTRDARIRNLDPGVFSFNTPGGRCDECEGAGSMRVDMQFLADVFVTCPRCEGRRFHKDILRVRYNGRSIHDVLNMTVHEATRFFADQKQIARRLRYLTDTGLGYLKLGQPATTLSGGEAQRLKLASQMASSTKERLLFIFDEPTVGLHFDDVRKLLSCFQSLVDGGHSVLVVEHNLDVVKYADHVIDLGPEQGEQGGEVVVAGTPEAVARCGRSHTGRFLRDVLRLDAVASGRG
ncbi:MAG: excinuclease ABC subunit A [Planctomycetes bacterium SM23_32]|nr:MAG: excinuclease ABC subunit A [Planctomycetes bacterium SM23_32]